MHPNNAAVRVVELLEKLLAVQERVEAKLDALLSPPADDGTKPEPARSHRRTAS